MANSLKRTLLLWMLVPMLAIVPAAAALQYALVLQPTREAFDQSLGNAAISVASFVRWQGDAVAFDMNPQAERALRTDQSDSIYYAVFAPDGWHLLPMRRYFSRPRSTAPRCAWSRAAWRVARRCARCASARHRSSASKCGGKH